MKTDELQRLLEDMTLEEKAEQLVQLHGGFFGDVGTITGPAAEFSMDADQPYRTGSVLGEAGAEHLRDLQDRMMAKQPHGIPALFMADVIHGYKTAFPVPIAIGSGFDAELAEEIASLAAEEAAAAGVHVTFSPMVDLVRDSRWGRCMESTGEDPYLNSMMAKALVKGFQGDDVSKPGKVAACVKHFAAYGAPVAGRDYNVTEICEHTLFEDYLKPYRAAVEAGVKLVMTAFNTIDRKPCTTNKRLLRDVLRGDMGFDGVVISDYNAIGETLNHGSSYDKADAAKKALEAGCDIDMMSDCYLGSVVRLIREGELDEKLLDEAVRRVLVLKNELGLFENPYKDGSVENEKRVIFSERHRELGRRAGAETAVLLKNNGILPLGDSGKIAVVGELTQDTRIVGSWSIFADTSKTVTLKNALCEVVPNGKFVFIGNDDPTDEEMAEIGACDAVILAVGENEIPTGESMSVADISLNKAHMRIFERVMSCNKNTVVLVFGGRPLAIPEIAEKAPAIVEAWLPGTLGCLGIADILFGKKNPCGRLSMSIPYCSGQLPISYSQFMTGRPKPKTDGFVRYVSNYMDVPNHPLYPFGYGLSYGEAKYSPVRLSADVLKKDSVITATVDVTNDGGMEMKEAVQLYIRDVKGSVVRPVRELKGLKTVRLMPHETKTVSFEIDEPMLRFYDADMNFVSEPGEFVLWIGHDSGTENGRGFKVEG